MCPGGQAFLVGTHISPYSHGNRENKEPERVRRLLLKKREIEPRMRAALEAGAAGKTTDHAGYLR